MTISENVYGLVHGKDTVTSVLAQDPSRPVGDVVAQLYGKHGSAFKDASAEQKHTVERITEKFSKLGKTKPHGEELSKEDLDRAAECGNFGRRPSDLFLKMYHDVLTTLDGNPLASFVSPPLLGSRGTLPMSIVSVIPDIIDHYQTCIMRAETEVFLATNYWENSKSSHKINDGLIELSKRAEKRGKKVIVKLMYDRGNPKQLKDNHIKVEEEEWLGDAVQLPKKSDMPFVDLEVVNFHRPMLGTFHSKYAVIDRKVAILSSNNIQDRPNVEMMTHIEGPIVSSFYDVALLSWHLTMNPPLPLLGKPYEQDGPYQFGLDNTYASERWLDGSRGEGIAKERRSKNEPTDGGKGASLESRKDGQVFIGGQYESITDHINAGNQDTPGTYTPSSSEPEFTPHLLHLPHEEFPMAIVNRPAHGRPGHGDTDNGQDVAWLAAFKYAQKSVFIQTPTLNASPLIPAIISAVKRGLQVTLYVDVGFNDSGEALPFQGGTNEEVAKKVFGQLEEKEKENLKLFWYTAKDQDRPINAHINTRNCHVKIMIVDETVGIQGNGNQDAQSWFHSSECNVMVDSPAVCKEWRTCIDAVQNTARFGRVGGDGIWRDEKGQPASDSTGVKSGPMGLFKGIQGSIKRVQGKGGF